MEQAIEIRTSFEPDELEHLHSLVASAKATNGFSPFPDSSWEDFCRGRSPHTTALAAFIRTSDDDESPHDSEAIGLGLLRDAGSGWDLHLTMSPSAQLANPHGLSDLVTAAKQKIREEGASRQLTLWFNHPRPSEEATARSAGLNQERTLYQMRRSLPLPEHSTLRTRAFKPGTDEQAWLEVNNRAFAWHPEQGGWDQATLLEREAQEWFDPEGFLLYEMDGQLAAFCWTKVHAQHAPPLGEIYVVAIDPSMSGRGLGRQIVLAGLDHLADQGLKTAMLYVEATNTAALRLYIDLGFQVDHLDKAFSGDV